MATQQQIDELFEKLEEERGAFLDALSTIDEQRAEARPPEGEGEAGWSVKEQLAHIAGMEYSYRQWVIRALNEERPDTSDGRTPNEPRAIPQEHSHGASLEDLTEQVVAERAATLDLARTIGPDQFERTAIVPAFGELTVMQWLRSYYRHDRMHRAQILGEQSEYVPRFSEGFSEAPREAGRADG